MANTIRLKRKTDADGAPLVGDLVAGELALNNFSGRLFMEKTDGGDAIVEMIHDQGGQTIGGALTITGAFTSLGIDDNATKEVVQITDNGINLGDGTAAETYLLSIRDVTTGRLTISGGSGTTNGANIALFGETAAGTPGDTQFKTGSVAWQTFDESAGEWTLSTNTKASRADAITVPSSGVVRLNQTMRFTERADHIETFPTATFGELWVRSDTPNVLVFTDDAGTDWDLNTAAGSGDVTKVGTPVDNQVGVWTGDGTIEGDTGFTYIKDNIVSPMLTITANASMTGGSLFQMVSNVSTKTNFLLNVRQEHASSSADCINCVNDGTGNGIEVQVGTATGSAARFYSITATRTQPLVEIINDSPTGAGVALYVQNDQSGAAIDVVGNIAVTGTVDGVDLQTLNTAVGLNTAKITNATHTGQVTGSGALALDVTAITAQPASGAISAADTILINDGGVLSEATFTQMDTYFNSSLSFGTGDVTKVGTPVDNQIGVWTGDGTIEGDANFTFDGAATTGAQLSVVANASLASGPTVSITSNVSTNGTDLLFIHQDHASSFAGIMDLRQDGIGNVMSAQNTSASLQDMFSITNSANISTFNITDTGNDIGINYTKTNASGNALYLQTSSVRTASLQTILVSNTLSSGDGLSIDYRGTGSGIDSIVQSNTAGRAGRFYSNVASRTVPVVEIINDNVTGTGIALTIQQDQGGAAISHSGDILPTVTNVNDIGGSGIVYANVWATTFEGTATTAQYADLAEKYLTDADYEIGTVVMFGGEKEVTEATPSTTAIAGIVSEHPAFLMNKKLDNSAIVALRGRVPCKVYGPVSKGDLMVAGTGGVAVADNNANPNAVLGRAIATNEDGHAIIEVVV